ncbi:uncharacterized protein LOC125046708 [Penaeus chinensis]|uniref:uncharacterized protein LOC125046708 n=1 Tax=Penaeus chinensis TaxID=139456 RepID=UPI001FB77066|nr:uncharacterized protein LOC125046708 [Penaeus chinensis]XP_047500549.1 uncharacterized protein LOC125046708 [Penaeus chinensis]XP_047500550.1 uncharacterized protein LOC125046708 [Penaeus chinensis]
MDSSVKRLHRGSRWMWLFVGILAGLSVELSAAPQSFPVAVEENAFSFNNDGTYMFSYDTGSGEHQSFRTEERDAKGGVTGRFGYVDPDGALRITEYQADTEGYRANMLIYHRVNSAPRDPLIVGPLPQRVPPSAPLSGVEDRGFRPPSGPVGPIPFFPPKGPVLIIGPLPKPLQPKGILSSSQEFKEIFFDTAATPPQTGGRGSEEQAGQTDSPSEGTLQQEMGISLKSSLGDFSVSFSQRNTSMEVNLLAPANRTGNNLTTIIETPEESRIGDMVETIGNQSLQFSFKDTNNQNLSVFLLSAAEGTLFPTLKLHSVSDSMNNTKTESYSNLPDLYLQNITNITNGRDNDTKYKTSQPLKTNTAQAVITLLSASKTPTPVLHLETPDKEYPPDLNLQRIIAPTENTSHHPKQSSTTEIAVASDLPAMTSTGNSFSRAPSSAVVIRFDSSLPSTHTPSRPFTYSTDETSAASRMKGEISPAHPLTDNSRTVAEPATSVDLPPLFYLPVKTSVDQADNWNQLRRQR